MYEDGDLNRDDDVDMADLTALLAVYGTTCEQEAAVELTAALSRVSPPARAVLGIALPQARAILEVAPP